MTIGEANAATRTMPSTSPDLLARRPAIVTVLVDREIEGRAQGGPCTSTTSVGIARTASHSSIDAWWERHGAAEAAAVERILNRVRAPLKPGIGSRSEPSIPRAMSPHSESREAAFLEKFSNKSTSDVLQWLSANRVRNTLGENELPPSNLFKKCFYDEKEFLSFVHRPCVTSDKAETTRHSWPPTSHQCTHNGTGKDKKTKQATASAAPDAKRRHDDNDVDRHTPRRNTHVRRAKRHKTQVERLKQLGILMHDSEDDNSSHGDIMDSSSYGSDDSASLNAHSIRPPIVRSMVLPQTQQRSVDDEADSEQLTSAAAVHNTRNDVLRKRDYIPRDVPSSASSASSSASSSSSDSVSEPEETEQDTEAPISAMATGTGQATPAASGKSNRDTKQAAKPKTKKQKPVEHPRAAERRQARLNNAKETQLKSIYTSKTTSGTKKASKLAVKAKQSTRDGLMSPFTERMMTGTEACTATGPQQTRATPSLQHIQEDPLNSNDDNDGGEAATDDVFGVQGALIPGKESVKSKKHHGRQRKEREPRRRRRVRDPSASATATAARKLKASIGNESSSSSSDGRRAAKERVAVDSDDDAAAKRNMKLLEDKLRQKAEKLQKDKARRDSKQKAKPSGKPQGKEADSSTHKQSKGRDGKQQGNAGRNPSKKPSKSRLRTQPSKLATVPELAPDGDTAPEEDVPAASQALDAAHGDAAERSQAAGGSVKQSKQGKSSKKAVDDRSQAAKTKASAITTRSTKKKASGSTTSAKQRPGDLAVNSKAADFSSGRLMEPGTSGREPPGVPQQEASSQKAGSKIKKKPTPPPPISSQQRRRQQLSKVANTSGGSRGRFPSNSSGPSPTSSTIATIRSRDVRSRGIAADDDLMTQNPQIVKYERPCDVKPPAVKVAKRPKLAAIKIKPPKKPKETVSAPAKELERQKTLSSLAAMLVQDNHRVRHPDTFRMREKGKPRVAYIPQIPGEEKSGITKTPECLNGRIPLSDVELNELQPLPSIKEVESVKKIKEAFQRRGKEKMEQRFKQLMRLAKRELGHQYGLEYRRATGFDQLAQFCIVEDSKLELYAKAFAIEDVDEDGILNEEQLLSALESLHTISHVSPQQLDYVLKVLECEPSINFKMFAVIAALCERIGTLDKDTRMFLDGLNLASIERKMAFYKQLFIGSSETMAGKTINADDLRIELKAGGLPQEMENHIVNRCDDENSGSISFLNYMAYIPLFVQMHESIVDNPFDSFADAFGLASSCSAESSTCPTTDAQYRRESIVVEVVRSPHPRGGSSSDGVPGEASPSANQSRASTNHDRSPTSHGGNLASPVCRILVSPSARLAMLQEAQERKQRLRETRERAQSPGTAATEREESAMDRDHSNETAAHVKDVSEAQEDTSEHEYTSNADVMLERESSYTGHKRATLNQSPGGNPVPSSLNESEQRADGMDLASSSSVCVLDEKEAGVEYVVLADRSGNSEQSEPPRRPEHASSLIDINDVEVAVSRAQSREARPLPTAAPRQDAPTSSNAPANATNERAPDTEQNASGSLPENNTNAKSSSDNESSVCASTVAPYSTATDVNATSQLSQADTVQEGDDTTGMEEGRKRAADGWRKGKRASQYVRRHKWSDERGSSDDNGRQAKPKRKAAVAVVADGEVLHTGGHGDDASVGTEPSARQITTGEQTPRASRPVESSQASQQTTVHGSNPGQPRQQTDIDRSVANQSSNDGNPVSTWQQEQTALVFSIGDAPIMIHTPSSTSNSDAGAPTVRYRSAVRRWSGSDSASPVRRPQRKPKRAGAGRRRRAERSNSASDDGGLELELPASRTRRKPAASVARRQESSDDDDDKPMPVGARTKGRARAQPPVSDSDDAGPARRRANRTRKTAARRQSSREGSPAADRRRTTTRVPQPPAQSKRAKESRPEPEEGSKHVQVPAQRKDPAVESRHKPGDGGSIRPNSDSDGESGGNNARRKPPANRKARRHRHKQQDLSAASSGSDAPPKRKQREHRTKKSQKARHRARRKDDSSDA